MSFIEVALAEAKIPEVQPEGVYNLVVEKADIYKKDGGSTSLRCFIGFEDVPNAAAILHFQGLPGPDDDTEKRNIKLVMMTQFLKQFNIQFEGNGFAIEDCFGARGRAFVEVVPDQNNIPRNRITYKKI